jgi:hypothetical protein
VAPWSLPPVVWRPLEQLNPHNPLHPVLADPNVESEADGVKRFRAHYKAVKKITTPVPRPRKLTRHAEWCVLNVVCGWTHAAIAAAESESDPDGVEVSTVTRGIHQIRDLLQGLQRAA